MSSQPQRVQAAQDPDTGPSQGLERHAIGLPAVSAQSAALIGPAAGSVAGLAFIAGYGLKAFLIAQSLNQLEKAYGPHNSILDNCHVRLTYAANDDRTARQVCGRT